MSESHDEPKKKHRSHGGHGHGGGGHEEHEGAPEWLISFADNVTLMMGFFVILLAMNLKPASKGAGEGKGNGEEPTAEILDAAIAIREAFHNPVDLGSTDPKDLPLIERIRQRTGESEAFQKGQKGREHDVRSIRPGRYYTLGGTISFDDGQTQLSATGLQEVRELAKQMAGHNLIIDIRGHTSAAEAFSRPDRGMQLSHQRAMAVAGELAERGIGWDQMRLTACADNDRVVAPSYEGEAHKPNQRVEIIVTDRVRQGYLGSDDEGPLPAPPAP